MNTSSKDTFVLGARLSMVSAGLCMLSFMIFTICGIIFNIDAESFQEQLELATFMFVPMVACTTALTIIGIGCKVFGLKIQDINPFGKQKDVEESPSSQ
jgi:hypothetical protein